MGIFGKKPQQAPSPGFDRDAGAGQLEQIVDAFLRNCGAGENYLILSNAEAISQAASADRKARASSDSRSRQWKWIKAVADQGEQDNNVAFVAKLGLMCQVWNRMILEQEPIHQMTCLARAPLDIELGLYKSALAALAAMPPTRVLVPGGEQGWNVGEAREQISHCVVLLTSEGVKIDAELRQLASP